MLSAILLACGAIVFYYFAVVVYRLVFHPLAGFPGPKLAAATLWYEFYYDVVQKGRYLWKIEELHKKYGPIVRINPMELHINDPDYFTEIYSGHMRGKTDKFQWWMHVLPPRSTAFTADHDLHKRRRGAIANHFSKKSIHALEPLIQEKADRLAERMRVSFTKGEPINLSGAFAALTMDVISRYSFGESVGSLEKEDYGIDWIRYFHMGCKGHPVGRQFPWLFRFFKNLPPDVLVYLNPLSKIQVDFEAATRQHVHKVLAPGERKTEGEYRTIFHEVIDSDLPASEKDEDRLADEAFIFLTAGTETTARTLAVIAFYILNSAEVLRKLQEELRSVMPTPGSRVPSSVLENLPYLHAVVAEGLRISHAFSSRLPRISRDQDLFYEKWRIPKGTPVSQSTYMVHMNEKIFPNAKEFIPERWLEDKTLEKQRLVAWSRGTRICLGMNLAYSEMYLTIGTLFRQFNMELYDTTRERDVDIVGDYFIGMPDDSSTGIKARIISEQLE